MTLLETLILGSYFFVLVILGLYGWHRYYLVYAYMKNKDRAPGPTPPWEGPLPAVTIQLPLYNEMYVVDRLLQATARIDYPKELLEIQVLDDSTDETTEVARRAVDRLAAQGFDIKYIHRTDRTGFKAGALDAGLKVARGQFVAIFDADFVPSPDFLQKTVPYFHDPKVALVQARWGHVNADYSLLTKVQAILLDAHFVLEHGGRNRAGHFFNFNGTAGIWRREVIPAAGGWQHDTLTEDLDLSYRAQLLGWKFLFLPDLVAPAEVPVEMNSFKSQQHRWAKGSIQTSLKLLPLIRRADVPKEVKKEAFFHLTANVGYLLMIPLTILLPITVVVRVSHGWYEVLLLDIPFFAAATFSVVAFYAASQAEQGRGWWDRVKYVPLVMALGIGLAVNQARAVVEALMGYETGFTRTPKHGVRAGESVARKRYKAAVTFQPIVELALAAYMTYGVVYLVEREVYYSLPFLVLFQAGFAYVGLSSLYEGLRGTVLRWSRALLPQPSPE